MSSLMKRPKGGKPSSASSATTNPRPVTGMAASRPRTDGISTVP
jgi:hypothetical protein